MPSNLERANLLREQGEQARARNDLPLAQDCYEKAVALLRDSGDPLRFAHTIRHLGDVLAEQHAKEAEACFIEALVLYRAHRPSLHTANAIRSYALLLSETGRHTEARPLWHEAELLYQAHAIEAGVEECRQRRGAESHSNVTYID